MERHWLKQRQTREAENDARIQKSTLTLVAMFFSNKGAKFSLEKDCHFSRRRRVNPGLPHCIYKCQPLGTADIDQSELEMVQRAKTSRRKQETFVSLGQQRCFQVSCKTKQNKTQMITLKYNNKVDPIRMKIFCVSQDTGQKNGKPQIGGTCLQNVSLLQDLYLEYVKSS